MTNPNLANTVSDFNELVANFDYPTAHEKFYHKDLIKHENENAPTINLDNHRKEMERFLAKISNNTAQMISSIVSDNISVTEWHYQFDHADWGRRDFKQVSIQRWKDDEIIHERHLYPTERW